MKKKITEGIKKELSGKTKKILYHEGKEIAKMAVGAIMLGGIIKEDWLKSNIFVWIAFALFSVLIIWFAKKEKEN